ncbi:avidin-like [Hemicordylus capensis]|uniref:avidin-like n=1 Tax=Hemicordylus capensis TaxID=884348 RepID=UPI002304B4AD|nr:avidin-like [Hemicordylus capensis]
MPSVHSSARKRCPRVCRMMEKPDRALSFALLCSILFFSMASKSQNKCLLSGTWMNDLGSNMTIGKVTPDGEFKGTYMTAVSAAGKPIQRSPLYGAQQLRPNFSFGFTVSWTFANSTTVFVGQCFVDKAGEETLQTAWLLRNEAITQADNWKATLVGPNVFKRIK